MLNSLDLPGRPEDTRVVVAMSGGVDSSVVAAMMKEDGYDVVGVTLQLYDHGAAVHAGQVLLCRTVDIHDARRAAETIGIPHYVLDYESRFKEQVMDRFAESYIAGETPIPCVSCNQTVKFSRPSEDRQGPWRRRSGDRALCPLAPERQQARHVFRPKPIWTGIRAISCSQPHRSSSTSCAFRSANLPKARRPRARRGNGLVSRRNKPDSQDICFVPNGKLCRCDRASCARMPPSPAKSSISTGVCWAATRASSTTRSASAAALASPPESPLYVVRLDANPAGDWSARARRWRPAPIMLRESTGSAMCRWTRARGLDSYAKVRSTRPPAPARLRMERRPR